MTRTTPIERDPARLHEALPWYLNGTLADDDRAWVEQMLAVRATQPGADLQPQIDFDRSLTAAFQQKVEQVPADIGWSSLLQRVRQDAAAQASGADAPAGAAGGRASRSGTRRTWMDRLGELLAPIMSPQLGMALAVLVAVQTIAIGVLLGQRDGGAADTVEYRSGGGAPPTAAIRALFNDSITEKTLRQALSAQGAVIVEGPNPLGEYWIVTGERDPEAVAGALRAAGVIATYVIDHRRPGR
jgi:hypothetical protein